MSAKNGHGLSQFKAHIQDSISATGVAKPTFAYRTKKLWRDDSADDFLN